MTRVTHFPRSVRAAPDPLGLYIRPSHNDHRVLSNLIAAGDARFFGAVLDPTHLRRQGELRDQILERGIDLVLDPKTQEAASPGRYSNGLGKLPWIGGRLSGPNDFVGTQGRRRMAALAGFAIDEGFTQVMAATRYLRSSEDEWLDVDISCAIQLRDQLDKRSSRRIPIIYSLAVPYKSFRTTDERFRLINTLRGVPMDALWLKIGGIGSDATSTGVLNYVEAAADFHELGVPIVADFMGGMAGLALVAFGSVGGIAHGVTFGEKFDPRSWSRPPRPGRFGLKRRVYVAAIDMMLEPLDAQKLLTASHRTKSQYGCKDKHCCPRGIEDMIGDPARHFLVQRMKHIGELSQIPEQLRPQRFLDNHLRPATDLAVAAERFDWGDEDLAKKARKNRKRLDNLRVALGNHAAKKPLRSFALHPRTRASRER